MEIDLKEYINIFIEESGEHIQELDILLVDLEKNKKDKKILKKIYRIMHTLKGISGIVGFNDMSSMLHSAETCMDMVLNAEITLHTRIIESLFEVSDVLKSTINSLREGGQPAMDFKKQSDQFSQFIKKQPSKKSRKKHPIPYSFDLNKYNDKIYEALEQKQQAYTFSFIIDKKEEVKDSRRRILFRRLSKHGEILDYRPRRTDDYYTKNDLKINALFIGTVTDELLADVRRVDRIHKFSYEEIDSKKLAQKAAPAAVGKEIKAFADKDTVKVKVEKLDSLLNYAQELTILNLSFQNIFDRINEFKSLDDLASDLNNPIDALAKTTQNIHQEIMRVRMVPIAHLFQRFHRPVRDIAANFGKKVGLKIKGEDEEIDKNAIELLFEPLLHLVRNAIDHGIETPEQRVKAKKPAEATLELRSYSRQNRLFIEVYDDGRGIDPEMIKKKAVERGIIEATDEITEERLIELIFLSSFSTKEKANELAGRGLGMNIVAEAVKKLGGEITTGTEKGKSTTFTISLPSTMEIISVLIIRAAGGIYALPLGAITEIIDIAHQDIKTVKNNEVFMLRDTVVPLIKFEKYFEVTQAPPVNGKTTVIIIESDGQRFGLTVEEILKKQEVVVKPLPEPFGTSYGINGVTVLGDGSVALIIDVNTLVKQL
ncbi:MAG: chemotaxis protein CheA [Spirochaetales bacterium]|nr:chemotaxis protein CheA [Spirochaetales bacterium]